VFFKVLEILLLPLFLVMRCVKEISGERRWYRQQRRRMECARPALSDDEFLRAVGAGPHEEWCWLSVRHAIADSVGLAAEAVQPQDRLADLWRMQWLGPDIIDLVFRLEKQVGFKIPRQAIERFTGRLRYGQPGEFQEFARNVVCGLRELRKAPITERVSPADSGHDSRRH
jgi:hypothetical protein